MSSNSACNHTRDKQIGLPLRGRPILLSLVWLQTELDSTQSYYHYLSNDIALEDLFLQHCVVFLLFCVAIVISEPSFAGAYFRSDFAAIGRKMFAARYFLTLRWTIIQSTGEYKQS